MVKTRNKLVMQLQLKKMTQGAEEPVQSFLGRMKPIARNCGFQTTCASQTCNKPVDYTDAIVLMQMIAGLADDDIQRKIFGQLDKTLKEAEKFIIAEESGKWSQLEITEDKETAAGLSSYKKRKH